MKFWKFFLETTFMNALDFWECIYDICLKFIFYFYFLENAFMNA